MNYIIYDVEATCWRHTTGNKQEIIEIGAVKLDGFGEPQSIFSTFVRPVVHPRLSTFCTELTSIQQTDVNRAPKFGEIIEDFQDWIDIFESDYLLCSWGDFDHKILRKNCLLHDFDPEWIEGHYINLKHQYKLLKGLHQPIGLAKALRIEGFEFTGAHHRGIDDAKNLVKIFQKYIDQWMY